LGHITVRRGELAGPNAWRIDPQDAIRVGGISDQSSSATSAVWSGVKLNDRTEYFAATLNQFVTEFRSASSTATVNSNCAWVVTMRTKYRPVNRTRYYSPNARQTGHLASATFGAGNVLAVMCLFLGMAAAFVPASLEQRIGSLFFFGLIPAAGFHAGGLALGHLLAFSSELSGLIAVLCFRRLARFVNKFVILASPPVSYASATC
jgi:hypothetical protein